MPANFEKCVRMGGRVRTVKGPNKMMGMEKGQYIHVCFDKNGKSHMGEVKTKEKKK